MQVSDGTGATRDEPGVFRIDVGLADDDGGGTDESAWLVVTNDRDCTETRSAWRRQYDAKQPPSIDPGLLQRYLHVLGFASVNLSERFFPTLHDTSCLHAWVSDLRSDNSVDLGDGDRSNARGKALAEVVAAWLNFASGSVDWELELEPGGERLHEAMAGWEATILDPTTTHLDRVKTRLEVRAVNVRRPCGGGLRDLGVPQGSRRSGHAGWATCL